MGRQQHVTDAERTLSAGLRSRGVAGAKFRRQVPIGPFIADFACIEKRLVVEVDGGQHAHAESPDCERTRVLATHGYTVLRFWNTEVLQNLDGVLTKIAMALS